LRLVSCKIWSAEDLKEIARNLAVLSEPAVREVYQRAYRECAIINSRTFPSARSMHELVTGSWVENVPPHAEISVGSTR
jgi:hypothetical protein